MNKRVATEDEIKEAMIFHHAYWNFCNPSFEHDMLFWENKLKEAIEEGYKNETCECGVTALAFHHFTTCKKDGCPISNGISLLDMLKEKN